MILPVRTQNFPRRIEATFRAGGTHLDGRCRDPRRTMPPAGHTPCPESPGARRAARVFRCSGVQVSPSRALDRTAPSGTSPVVANRHSATSSFPGSATIPRFLARPSRALTYCLNHPDSALSGWWWSQRQAIRARCFRSIGLPALPGPGRGPPRRPATAPAPARPCRPAAAGSAGPGRTARPPAEARRSGRCPSAGPAPPRGGRAPGPPPARLRAAYPPPSPVPGASALSAPAASVTAACAPPSSPGTSRASRAGGPARNPRTRPRGPASPGRPRRRRPAPAPAPASRAARPPP